MPSWRRLRVLRRQRPAEESSVYTHGERVGGLQLDLELPLILHPSPRDTLVIAFGTEINIRGFAADEGIERLTCVDIDPALPGLARNLPWETPFFDGERSSTSLRTAAPAPVRGGHLRHHLQRCGDVRAVRVA